LTHPTWQWSVKRDSDGDLTKHSKYARIQQECWGAYTKLLEQLAPIDRTIFGGDGIDGRGEKSGGTELITSDREEQCNIAVAGLNEIRLHAAKGYAVRGVYGCLTERHKVLTGDLRWVSVSEVKEGDVLVGFDENTDASPKTRRSWRKAIVTHNGPRREEVYDVELSDGTYITATGDHPFLVPGNTSKTSAYGYSWRTVLDIKRSLATYWEARGGMPFVRTIPMWDTLDSREAGYLAGFFDGEGCLSGSGSERGARVSAVQKDNVALALTKRYLRKLAFPFGCYQHDKGIDGPLSLKIKGGLKEHLRFLGSVRPARLLEKLDPDNLGAMRTYRNGENLRVVRVVPRGKDIVWGIGTTTGTYVSDGFLSHNTGYHTGSYEDWENKIANDAGFEAIGAHDWPEVEGVVFDVKHHVGSSSIPHGRATATLKEMLWNELWSVHEHQPRSDVMLRFHVHYSQGVWNPDMTGKDRWGFTCPALQAMGSKFGARRCSGMVHWGLMHFDCENGKVVDWGAHIIPITRQKAKAVKF